MDFPSPTEISLNQVTQELIEDVAVLAHRVNKLRPLAREVIEQIEGELLEERVYNSNAIEGNTLTLRETKRILEAGDAIGVGRKREATEVINLGNAIAQLQTMIADRDTWCDASRFLEIHKTLLSGVMDDAAGVLRSQDVMIGGAKHHRQTRRKCRDWSMTCSQVCGMKLRWEQFLSQPGSIGRSLEFIRSSMATVGWPGCGRILSSSAIN